MEPPFYWSGRKLISEIVECLPFHPGVCQHQLLTGGLFKQSLWFWLITAEMFPGPATWSLQVKWPCCSEQRSLWQSESSWAWGPAFLTTPINHPLWELVTFPNTSDKLTHSSVQTQGPLGRPAAISPPPGPRIESLLSPLAALKAPTPGMPSTDN